MLTFFKHRTVSEAVISVVPPVEVMGLYAKNLS